MVPSRRTGISTTAVVLLLIIIALASTTAYFAYQANTSLAARSGPSNQSGSFLAAGASGGIVQSGGGAYIPNSITVSGAGAVSYTPNEALVRVSTVSQNKTAADATNANAAITLRVIKALNAAGISNSSIQTQGYTLSVNYSSCFGNSNCIPQITGFTVTNSLQVNITSSNPTQLGTMAGTTIDTAVGAGANQISLSFSETNSVLATLSSGALQQALAAASSQAKVIANSLGVSITGVISASQSSNSVPQYYTAGAPSAVNGPVISTPIIPGTQSFTMSVQVVYAIT